MATPNTPQTGEGQGGTNPASGHLGAHFTYAEMTRTDTGLPNVPGPVEFEELVRLVADILEPARELVGALRVNSGFRSEEVNQAIGGAQRSQHMKGQAADVVPLKLGLERAFQDIKASKIPYDQLIIEPTWLHISVAPMGVRPRRQTLRARREGGDMVYTPA